MFDHILAQWTRQIRIRLNILGSFYVVTCQDTHDGTGALGGLEQKDVNGLTLIEQQHVQRVCLAGDAVTAPGGHPAISGQRSEVT